MVEAFTISQEGGLVIYATPCNVWVGSRGGDMPGASNLYRRVDTLNRLLFRREVLADYHIDKLNSQIRLSHNNLEIWVHGVGSGTKFGIDLAEWHKPTTFIDLIEEYIINFV